MFAAALRLSCHCEGFAVMQEKKPGQVQNHMVAVMNVLNPFIVCTRFNMASVPLLLYVSFSL